MPYSADLVDELLAKFQKCAQRQNANKGSAVKLRAAENDLLTVAEKTRDLLNEAVKGDRDLLVEVFGGNCRRFHHFRQAMDTVELSPMHASDQRWQHLSKSMDTVEEILKPGHLQAVREGEEGPPRDQRLQGPPRPLHAGRQGLDAARVRRRGGRVLQRLAGVARGPPAGPRLGRDLRVPEGWQGGPRGHVHCDRQERLRRDQDRAQLFRGAAAAHRRGVRGLALYVLHRRGGQLGARGPGRVAQQVVRLAAPPRRLGPRPEDGGHLRRADGRGGPCGVHHHGRKY
mmetsp:Transcript_56222/g.174361  ORF Transcript_56222/g.174361 Transcript_56222/m.174361 type:complete len:286 (+) Transcript_56222:88-945(+)